MVLDPSLQAALQRAAGAQRLLTCWDFDGTLAPIVSDPDAARPLPGAMALLRGLAALPDTPVALLSGRARSDLARLSGAADPIVLVGSHGAELPPDMSADRTLDHADRLAEVLAAVRAVTDGVAGVLLEPKPVSVAVHVRNVADRASAAAIVAAVVAGPGSWPGVHITTGKEVVELSVQPVDKGAAITALRDRFAASTVVFVGDDVTDERGFAVLRGSDVGVKVGSGTTAAAYRVDDPAQVLELAAVLVAARTPASGGVAR